MNDQGLIRYVPHTLIAATVFEFMHIGDELAGNWAPVTLILEPSIAAVSLGLFVVVPLLALWMITSDRHWGYAISAAYSLFFFVTELWHVFDPAHMTAFRWAVVLFAQLFFLLCFLLSVRALQQYRPWRGMGSSTGKTS